MISRSFTHRSLQLSGRLLDAQGQPIGSATLDILQQTAGSSSTRVITHAKTQANGTFAVRVPAGPSRLIEVVYRAFADDASYAAQATVDESVAASVQLSITPRHTNPDGTIILTGKVQGPIPPQGTIVELLVHYRGHWEPFRTPRTDPSGNFEVPYQFEGGTGHFPFRAEIPAGQANFPYSGGSQQGGRCHHGVALTREPGPVERSDKRAASRWPRSIQIVSVRILSHAHEPQLVKMTRTRRRQDVLALRHHDALALKLGDCAAQYRRRHVVDLGFELGA